MQGANISTAVPARSCGKIVFPNGREEKRLFPMRRKLLNCWKVHLGAGWLGSSDLSIAMSDGLLPCQQYKPYWNERIVIQQSAYPYNFSPSSSDSTHQGIWQRHHAEPLATCCWHILFNSNMLICDWIKHCLSVLLNWIPEGKESPTHYSAIYPKWFNLQWRGQITCWHLSFHLLRHHNLQLWLTALGCIGMQLTLESPSVVQMVWQHRRVWKYPSEGKQHVKINQWINEWGCNPSHTNLGVGPTN